MGAPRVPPEVAEASAADAAHAPKVPNVHRHRVQRLLRAFPRRRCAARAPRLAAPPRRARPPAARPHVRSHRSARPLRALRPVGPGALAVSRHDAVLAYTGRDVAALVRAGNLLVSTRESSRENLELISKHPEVEARLMMWTKAVFLCISTCDATGGGLIALGTSQPLPGAPRTSSHARRWAARSTRSSTTVGLVHVSSAVALAPRALWLTGRASI